MQIGLTNHLRQFLHYGQFGPNAECDPFFCWDANRVKIGGRVMLILCNVSSRFCCITAMRSNDWKHMEYVCNNLIAKSLLSMGFCENSVDEYLHMAGHIEFGKTHGRKALGCMNNAVMGLTYGYGDCDHKNQFQKELVHWVNTLVCHSAVREDYKEAVKWMEQDLLEHGIDPYKTGTASSPSAPPIVVVPPSNPSMPSDHNGQEHTSTPLNRPQQTGGCSVCGAKPRVFLGKVPYCLDCYNKMVERDLGIPHVTRDNSVFIAFDSSGRAVQFAVERMLMPHLASWTAREMIEKNDARKRYGYEGVSVTIYADPEEDQDLTLAKLAEKTQETLSKPSIDREKLDPNFPISNGINRDNMVCFANKEGWGRIDMDDWGNYCLVIDGERYSGEEFLRLLSCYEGFNLTWNIRDQGDPLFGQLEQD